jgi:uncharacterized protein YlzI (FlbEa/FlbD family)
MIILHTIKGQELALNGGLIERVEQDTETHITLATGTSYLVREPLSEVVHLHQLDRAAVRLLATRLGYERGDDPELTEDGGELFSASDAVDPTVHTILQFPHNRGERRHS